MQKKSRNYWPHAIIISLILIAIACAYTIVKSFEYPVELDTFYFQDYQYVDKNYDKIEAAQKAFNEKYTVSFIINNAENTLSIGENSIALKISGPIDNSCDFNADIKLLLTRPETNKLNQNLTISNKDGCLWNFEPFMIEKAGRWQFQTKIAIGEDVGFFKHEANVTR